MRKAIIQRMEMFLHHGEPYFQIGLSFFDQPENVVVLRLGNDALPEQSKVGDIVKAVMLMGTVIRLERP
jgi:hypothetical protein